MALKSGKIFLEQIDEYALAGVNFCFETTLSSLNYQKRIILWKKSGYHVKLIFLKLPDYNFAARRIKQRIRQGGHSIHPEIIKRRFTKGIHNFYHIYKQIVDSWQIYDNAVEPAVLLEEGENK
jgi:predicted ABC-type ATPase